MTPQEIAQNEEALNKSLDSAIDLMFADEGNQEDFAKSIEIYKDSDTTADAAVSGAPKGQKDESRGAGRPKSISGHPDIDTDGSRTGNYDTDITENEGKEDEPDEAKKAAKKKGLKGGASEAPAGAPFKKSIDQAEFEAFQAWKAEQEPATEESLIKAHVEPLQKAFGELQDRFTAQTEMLAEQSKLIKSMASRPNAPKSILGVEQLSKSQDPSTVEGPTSFTKSQRMDAAEQLVKSGTLREDVIFELDTTGTIYNPQARAAIDAHLQNQFN